MDKPLFVIGWKFKPPKPWVTWIEWSTYQKDITNSLTTKPQNMLGKNRQNSTYIDLLWECMSSICYENACQVPTAGIPQVLTEWCKRLFKGGVETRAASILLSDHHSPDPMPNAAHTSDPLLATTLRGTRVNQGPERLSNSPSKDSGKACILIPALCPSRAALGFPWGQPWKTGQERHHSVNSLCNRLNSFISLTCSLTVPPVNQALTCCYQ